MKPSTLAVLRLLRRNGPDGLSALEALYALGVYRLSARVMELRRDGYGIVCDRQRTAAGPTYGRYRLVGEP